MTHRFGAVSSQLLVSSDRTLHTVGSHHLDHICITPNKLFLQGTGLRASLPSPLPFPGEMLLSFANFRHNSATKCKGPELSQSNRSHGFLSQPLPFSCQMSPPFRSLDRLFIPSCQPQCVLERSEIRRAFSL